VIQIVPKSEVGDIVLQQLDFVVTPDPALYINLTSFFAMPCWTCLDEPNAMRNGHDGRRKVWRAGLTTQPNTVF
jgi:hypothetical protein